jgi:K+-sensing histidine kinase KdpD
MARLSSRPLAYGGAVIVVALAAASTALLWPWLDPSTSVLFFPAVMIAATYGGLGPGLLAALLAAASIAYFFMPPYWSIKVSAADFVRLLAFLGSTILIASVASARRRAEDAVRRARDQSDQLYRALEASFERESQAEAARQNERLKAHLLDALTHNLRTPLTAMKAAVTALRYDALTVQPETRQELLAVIDEEVDRLDRFAGGLGPSTAPTRVRPVPVDDLLRALQDKAGTIARDHRLVVDSGADVPAVVVDRTSTVEALYMILDNAWRYSPPASSIRITSERQDSGHVRVTITDEGPGIPSELRDRVFERFFRADVPGARDPQGSGLGLSIARQLILTQGGQIRIETAPSGAGTSVVTTLPTARDLESAEQPTPGEAA